MRRTSGRSWALRPPLARRRRGWRRFVRSLKRRGLSGVELATSDAHPGLVQALREAFPGLIWQRCQTEESLGVHFRRNVLDQTPSDYRDRMHKVLDQILEAASQEEAQSRFKAVAPEIEEKAPDALDVLEDGFFEATAILALPGKYRRRLRTTNMLERFIEEIRRREKVIYPHLPESRVGLSARRGPLRRDPRGVVHWPPVPEPRRILPVASRPSGRGLLRRRGFAQRKTSYSTDRCTCINVPA